MATETTDILSLPYIMPSQAQKHVTHNEAIAALDVLVQTVVTDEAATPPDTPTPGDRLIVAADATSAFAGKDNSIAAWRDGGWTFVAPQTGWTAYDRARQRVVVFTGSGWEELPPPPALAGLETVGINATADVGNRLAVASPASLFSHEGTDHRLKVNKAAETDTASLLFQDGYSGRAEMGLAGSDDFTVKISSDGTEWIEALRIDRASGQVRFPTGGPREVLTANRIYYVRTDGSDANDGLSNTAGGAFLTPQKAWDTVATLDLSIYGVTIQVADGTYASGIVANACPLGGAGITIKGNPATPANCHLDVPGSAFAFNAALPCAVTVNGFKMTAGGVGASGILVNAAGTVTATNIDAAGGSTGFAGFYYAAVQGAKIIISTGQAISGNMSCYVEAVGGVVQFFGITVTLTGMPAFSWQFATATRMGYIFAGGVTFSGEGTGRRYSISENSVLNTGGGGADHFPGDIAGAFATGGQYL
jgi:hypothetical protein